MSADKTLPPLPGSTSAFSLTGSIYTAEDMRDYARTALAQRADDPVAWMKSVQGNAYFRRPQDMADTPEDSDGLNRFGWIPLYAAAPAAPAYVPLSEDLVQETYLRTGGYFAFAHAIESLVVARMRGEGK